MKTTAREKLLFHLREYANEYQHYVPIEEAEKLLDEAIAEGREAPQPDTQEFAQQAAKLSEIISSTGEALTGLFLAVRHQALRENVGYKAIDQIAEIVGVRGWSYYGQVVKALVDRVREISAPLHEWASDTLAVCDCALCKDAVAEGVEDGRRCQICGYAGRMICPTSTACKKCSSTCSGGVLVCPVCENGAANGWAVVRKLRSAFEKLG